MKCETESKTYISTYSPEEWRQLLNEFDEIICHLWAKNRVEALKTRDNRK